MEESSMLSSFPTLTMPKRLLLAFLIGLPTTLMFPFSALPTPIWWNPFLPVLVLLVALVLSIVRDHNVREHKIAPARVRNALITIGLIFVASLLGEVVISRLNAALILVAVGIVPFMVGFTAVFALGSDDGSLLAWLCALVGWAGAAIPNIIATIFDYIAFTGTAQYAIMLKKTPNANISLVIWLDVFLLITGFVIAAFGGSTAQKLHQRLLGLPVEVGE